MRKPVRKLTALLVSAVFICGGFHPVYAEEDEKICFCRSVMN